MNENTDLLQPRSASSGDGGTHGSSGEPVAPMPHLVLALSLRFVLILLMGVGLHLAGQSLLWTDLGIIAVDAITFATLAHLMRGEGRRLRDLYVPTGGADIAWGLLFSVIIIVGFFVSTILANLIVYHGAPPAQPSSFVPPLWLGALALAVMPLTIAFAEEGLYRSYLLPRLARRMGQVPALLLVSVFFGLQHIGFAVPDGQQMLSRALTTLFAGLLFGGLWLWKRKTVPLVIGHWLLDFLFLGLPVFYMATSA